MAVFLNIVNNVANTTITTNNGDSYFADGQIGAFRGTIAITANDGYSFTEPPTATHSAVYYNTSASYGTVTDTAVLSDNNTVATFTIERLRNSQGQTQAAPVTLNGTTSRAGRTLQTVENLQNCTISGLPSTVTDQSTLNLTLTADTNCTFETTPLLEFGTVVVKPDGNPAQNAAFTVSNDKLTATLSIDLSEWNLDYMTTVETLTITAAATSAIYSVPITRNLTLCTTNAPTSISEVMTSVNIICTANNNCEFDTAPSIVFYDANNTVLHSFTFTVLQSKLSANVTFDVSEFNDFENVTSIVLTATANAIVAKKELTQILSNCTTNAPQYILETDTVINVTATANSNCVFNTAPQLFIIDTNGDPNVFNFTIAQDGLTASLAFDVETFDFDNIGNTCEITASADTITPYQTKYGSIHVYKLSENQLEQFSNQRFFVENLATGTEEPQYERIDLGNYVHSIKRVYLAVNDTVADVLKCGNYNTHIAVETPLDDTLTVDCGTVTIPTPNNSNVDFNSEITLFLPFVGMVAISNEFCGKTLNLVYRCNLIKGDAIAEITVNGVAMLQYECNIGYDIIYKTLVTQTAFNTVGNVDFNTQILKGLQPYAVLKYYTDKNAQIFNTDCLRVPLSEISGYFAANEIENFVSDTITDTEKQTLFNEIANGVFILAV